MSFHFLVSGFSVKVDEEVGRLVYADAVQLRLLELRRQALPRRNRDVLGGWNLSEEFRDFLVQEAVIHRVENFARHDFFELLEIDDKAGAGVDLTFYCDFERVVMAVTIGIVALAKDAAILFRRQRRIVVIVRCGEFSFAREIDHCSPVSGRWTGHLAQRLDTCGLSRKHRRGHKPFSTATKDMKTAGALRVRGQLQPRKNERGGFARK